MKLNLKRKSDIWVSNNRVLVGNNKKMTGRNPNFDLDETKLLIKLWGDPKIQRTLITSHKKYAVIVKLADKMRTYGYHRSPEEINTRIKNLKCFYNRLKKDLEMGTIAVPSWKHYSAMDEIMTRQIFSVRPNEVPKPSLRYRLEEESREREERRTRGESSTIVNNDNSIHNELIDCDDIMVVATPDIVCENDALELDMDTDDNTSQVKDEPPNVDFEDSIINIKDEPLDFENLKGFDEITEEGIANISDYLELSTSDSPTPPPKVGSPMTTFAKSRNKGTGTSKSNLNISSPSLSEASSLSHKQSVFYPNQKLLSQQNGKISLVPTSMLLQQSSSKPVLQSVLQPMIQPQQIQIRPQQHQQQHRILYTQPTSQANTGLVTTGPGGMKVLFVKANGSSATEMVQGSSAAGNGSVPTAKLPTGNLNTFMPGPSNIKINNARTTTLDDNSDKDGRDTFQVLQILLSNLIQLQNDNNELQRQRLDIERERLVFEKSIAEKIINVLPNVSIVQKANQEEKSTILEEPMTMIHAMDPVNNVQKTTESNDVEKTDNSTLPLLVPKIEKED